MKLSLNFKNSWTSFWILTHFLFVSLSFAAEGPSSTLTEPPTPSSAPTAPPQLPRKAMPGFGALGNLGLIPTSRSVLSYGGWITPDPAPGEIQQHRFTLQFPIYHDAESSYGFSAGGSSLHFGEPHTLSSSRIQVPTDLWKVELGGSFSTRLPDHHLVGGRISLGSASDQPFSNLNVTTIGLSAYYSWITSERSRWMLTVLFSNNNPLLNYVPIPGFTYMYQSETLTGIFGFPLNSIVWRFEDPWVLTLSIFGPTVNSEIGYGDPRKFQLFTGWSWLQQSYLRRDRPDPKDRLYFDEMHIPFGIRFSIAQVIGSELSFGYAFNRSVYEGIRYRNQDNGSVTLGHSWYAAWNLKSEF